jgi:hypothetical protein
MSRYAKVDTRMWGDEKYRALSRPQPNAQTLFSYLLTGPHHLGPGCFEAGEYGLAEKLRWPIEGFRAAFAELEAADMVRADWDAQVLFIVNSVKHDPPANANVVKHWLDLLDTVPECLVRTAYVNELKRYAERFHKPLEDDSPNPMPIPEPKPKQLPKQEPKEKETRERAADEPPTPADVQVIDSVSEITDDKPYGMVAMLCEENEKAVATMPPDWASRQRGIAKRLIEQGHGIEQVRRYIRYRKTAWNGTSPFDLRHVEKDIGAWELANCPQVEAARASPNGNGHRPVTFAEQKLQNTLDAHAEFERITDEQESLQRTDGPVGDRLRGGSKHGAIARVLGPGERPQR